MLPSNNIVKEGDYLLLYLNRRKKWIIKAKRGEHFHTHRGLLDLDSIIGIEYGSSVCTSLGVIMWILKPTIHDYVMKSKRKTQVVYPKDLGIIAAWTGMSPGHIVVESGTGSGALTMFVANLVRPNGHIYSFEERKEFLEIARKNIEKSGLSNYVTLKHSDAKKGLDINNADIALIDVGDPWLLVDPMYKSLRGGGILSAVLPTMNQVEKLTIELDRNGFVDIETIEIIMREIEGREGKTRPAMRMIGHTAYLTFARKINLNRKE
jgi:tRNA (adenine57-N1/adenine58-N1)-methyltransferase